MNATLSTLAAEAVSAYIDACGSLVTPTLAGLRDVEYVNIRTWTADGYTWEEVSAAIKTAWAAR